MGIEQSMLLMKIAEEKKQIPYILQVLKLANKSVDNNWRAFLFCQ